jgi:hypothetical protein
MTTDNLDTLHHAKPPIHVERSDLLEKLSPEKRALFEEIVALRKKIGPLKFDVVQALRELREDG